MADCSGGAVPDVADLDVDIMFRLRVMWLDVIWIYSSLAYWYEADIADRFSLGCLDLGLL